MSFKFWIKVFTLSAISFFTITSAFNYIINPYDIFNHNIFSSFIKVKNHSVSKRMRIFYNTKKSNPKNLMIGTSRIGILSANDVEKYLGKNTSNMSIPGANIEEQIQYLNYMINTYNIKNIVWSLDFFSFNPDLKNDSTFSYDRVNPNTFIKNDHKIALFSLQTTMNSFKTLIDNIKLKDKKSELSLKEQENQIYLAMKHKDIDLKTKIQLHYYSNKFLKYSTFNNPNSIQKNMKNFKKILSTCRDKKINIYIYTSPVQASFLNLYKKIGLENTFIHWKKQLQNITSYTDFATYNSITNNTYNFIDGTHIMPNFSPIIFAKIFKDSKVKTPKDFGIYKKQKQIHN